MKHQLFSTTLKQKIQVLENLSNSQLQEDWQVRASYFSNIVQISPNLVKFFEGVEFGNLVSQNYMLFRIRFGDQINKNMRIKLKDKYFTIKKITNVLEQNKILEIVGMEVA